MRTAGRGLDEFLLRLARREISAFIPCIVGSRAVPDQTWPYCELSPHQVGLVIIRILVVHSERPKAPKITKTLHREENRVGDCHSRKKGNVRGRFRVIQGSKDSGPVREEAGAQSRSLRFEDAILANLEGLYTFALRLLGGRRELAEDLVQETCLRALRAYETLHSPEKIKPWFFKILVNTYINQYHRQSRMKPIDVELSDSLLSSAPVASALTPEEQFFQGLLDREIQEALDRLPAEFRTVVWLADVEELSYLEISEILDCPPGTVASRLYRAHSLLREHLRARRRGPVEE